MTRLRARWLGRLPYEEAWDLQRALHEGRVAGRTEDDYLLLLEHPHVYTVGRFSDGANVLITPEFAAAVGAEIHRVDRGGDVTYHGPGQLVGYPIRHLGSRPDVTGHVRRMEQAIIATLGDLGIEAWREDAFPGVWTAGGKVAAIGVRTSRRVTMHGFALNVDPDPAYFGHIVPCGIPDRPVTTISSILARRVSIEEVVDLLVPRFASAFGYDQVEEQRAAFTRGSGRSAGEFDVDRLLATGTFSPEARSAPPSTVRGRLEGEPEKPEWMRVRLDLGPGYRDLKRLVDGLDLNTVCEEAGCPNIYECWGSGTATFMLLGDVCTRACGFCDVATGRPGAVDADEPKRVAEAVTEMRLTHAVLTSVNRDDLGDGGAAVFAATIAEIRARRSCDVEVLIPDFKGDRQALATVMEAGPDVLNHNTETVLRLQREVRTAANYGRSLALLARARWMRPSSLVKSGLIVGMGETREEVLGALADLRAVGVDVVTIGQYLRPTTRHRRVDRYVHPDEFGEYKAHGEGLGIRHVESGPLVRSSYHAREAAGSAR
ncbi:MAG: lipoyl synthase [Acidimicrobiia bacterium]|nr:MAG: lipoyl synthase [Acidimicrobiia bacterium]